MAQEQGHRVRRLRPCSFAKIFRALNLTPPRTPLGRTGSILGDLHAYDPLQRSWADFSAVVGVVPAPRYCHGFASAAGKLYVHGGFGIGKN